VAVEFLAEGGHGAGAVRGAERCQSDAQLGVGCHDVGAGIECALDESAALVDSSSVVRSAGRLSVRDRPHHAVVDQRIDRVLLTQVLEEVLLPPAFEHPVGDLDGVEIAT
jgi:hypothetical protein